jgi:2-methylcitrate dehydratase PrpD
VTGHDDTAFAGLKRLCDWAAETRFEDIPSTIQRRTAMVLLDDMASAVAARDEPEVSALLQRIPNSEGEAAIWIAPGRKATREQAAMINSIASNWCQLDEGHRRVMCHAGLYTIPPVIAEAEAENLAVQDVLRAIAIGYEIVCRCAETWRLPAVSLHPHALWSPLGAAAALAVLRHLNGQAIFDTLTTAITLGQLGPFRHGIDGALVQNTWTGLGVSRGFSCIDLVKSGITGISGSMNDILVDILGATVSPECLTAGLGETWALESSYHKLHACAQQSHAVVEAALQIFGRLGPASFEKISSIDVCVHSLGLTMNNSKPANTLSARFSIHHIVAAVLRHGHASVVAFGADTLRDTLIASLRAKVRLALYEPAMPWPNDRASRVVVHFTDGTKITGACLSAPGGPDQPFAEDVVLRKCDELTRGFLPHFSSLFSLVSADTRSAPVSWKSLADRAFSQS